MADIRKIIQQKIDLIENSPNRFISSVDKVQEKLLKDALKMMGELDTEAGQIVANQANLEKINVIIENLRSALTRGDYLDAVKSIVDDMDTTKGLTDTYFKNAIGSSGDVNQMNVLYSANRQNAVDAFIGQSTLEANFLTPVKNQILQAVTNGMSFKDLVANISTTVTGDQQRDGKLLKYAKQIASDAFSTTERNYTSMLADSLNVQFVRYIGGLISDSRCFCQERNNKYFHIEEVRDWGRGKLTSGDISISCDIGGGAWQGMYIGTNADNIEQWLGGYNCKHSLIFVSEINVPESVIKRAKKEGYYKS